MFVKANFVRRRSVKRSVATHGEQDVVEAMRELDAYFTLGSPSLTGNGSEAGPALH